MSFYEYANYMPTICQLSQVFRWLEQRGDGIKIPIRAAHKEIKALIVTVI